MNTDLQIFIGITITIAELIAMFAIGYAIAKKIHG